LDGWGCRAKAPTVSAGRHGIAGFFGDVHIFFKGKFAVFVLNQHACNKRTWPKDIMDTVIGWKHIEPEYDILNQVDNKL
jgi:hypothetical protein